MRRIVTAALIALALAAPPAEAVTAKDIMDLARAGLGDEVLLALIEVDGGVFNIDTGTLTDLKKAGVSERVIEAMVRSGRSRAPEPEPALPVYEPAPPPPQVIVIEHERPVVQQVAVPVPVYIAVPQARGRVRGKAVGNQPFDPSPGFGAPTPATSQPKPQRPVYWGWGGKLRPDAWKPADTGGHKGSGGRKGAEAPRQGKPGGTPKQD